MFQCLELLSQMTTVDHLLSWKTNMNSCHKISSEDEWYKDVLLFCFVLFFLNPSSIYLDIKMLLVINYNFNNLQFHSHFCSPLRGTQ